jgi:hypothetical protein
MIAHRNGDGTLRPGIPADLGPFILLRSCWAGYCAAAAANRVLGHPRSKAERCAAAEKSIAVTERRHHMEPYARYLTPLAIALTAALGC